MLGQLYLYYRFQFPLPVWSATAILALHPLRPEISTPVPRDGCDGGPGRVLRLIRKFQLQYPVRGATSVGGFPDNGASISTPAPAWGVTLGLASIKLISSISIHSPHEGYDCAGQATPRHMGHFNSHTRSWCVYRGISTPVPRVGYDCMVQ